MNNGTYTTYSLRKAAVLIACGIDPVDCLDGDGAGRVLFAFAADSKVFAVLAQHRERALRLIPDDLFDAQAKARRMVDSARATRHAPSGA